MRVGILTQYYPPEIGAPPARLSALAQHLTSRGHEVLVLTAMPNYPQGRIYPGYGGLAVKERRDGVDVHRAWVWPTQSTAVVPRTISYLSFVISSVLVGLRELPRLDVLITESPPLLLGMSGFMLSRLKRARWVFNVSDLWPESAVALGVLGTGAVTKLAYRLEAFCYRNAWRVSCQSREIQTNIDGRFRSVHTVRFFNGVNINRFSPARRSDPIRRELASGAGVVVLYAGLHGLAQGLDQLLSAADQLQGENLRVVLIGDGPEKASLLERAEAGQLTNVTFLPPRPGDAMPALLASADIAVVPLKTRLRGAVPSKLYEALASAVPVVLVATGEPAEIVRSARAGIVVDPGDVDGLATALCRLARSADERRRLGAAGRAAAVAKYDRTRLCDDFVRVLESA